jgi:hypothetical protein
MFNANYIYHWDKNHKNLQVLGNNYKFFFNKFFFPNLKIKILNFFNLIFFYKAVISLKNYIFDSVRRTFSFGFYYLRGVFFLLFIDACLTDDEPLWEPIE